MSTILYEALNSAREVSTPGVGLEMRETPADTTEQVKKVPKLADTVAALVPVEVLAAHAAILGAVSESSKPEDDGPVQVTITEEAWASRFWVILLVAAALLYAVPHLLKRGWDGWDWIRMLIPVVAFAAWTMLAEGTLFDAVIDWSDLGRTGVGVVIALLAILASKATADEAEKKQAETPQKEAVAA